MSMKSVLKGVNGLSKPSIVPLYITILLFVSISSQAAVKYSKTSGAWTTAANWIGGVPVANDTVFILSQHDMAVSSNLYSNSTYMFVIILGTLDLTANGKLNFNASAKVIIETGGSILGDGNNDQISFGGGTSEYRGGVQGNVTGPAYVGDNHSPTSGEGTSGCGCYSSASVAQCEVTSSDGYTVYALVWAQKILVETSPCTNGYNYDVRLRYNITFSSPPSGGSLYTLQGNIFCGSSSLFFDLPNNGGTGVVDSQGNAWRGVSDCGSATPRSLGCLNASVQVQGPGIASTTCGSPMPIKLAKFEATAITQGAQLLWETSMEKNFNYFQIERAGSDLNFSSIGREESKGGLDINVSYEYLDRNVKPGKNYYRLRSVDYDGSYEYSNVVFVNWTNDSGIKVYPNPTSDGSLKIELNDNMVTPTDVRLLDQMGHIVYQSELTEITSEIQLPGTIQPGLYHLRLFSGQRQEIIKVVIQ